VDLGLVLAGAEANDLRARFEEPKAISASRPTPGVMFGAV
jgi:hypothetical protein